MAGRGRAGTGRTPGPSETPASVRGVDDQVREEADAAVDAKTAELRAAHDVLAGYYAEHLTGMLERMPVERAVLDLALEHVRRDTPDRVPLLGDIGCGTGRLIPHLVAGGARVRGVDLSDEMVRVARRDQPGCDVQQADLRALPFADGELDGAVCWYSLIFLAPHDRPAAWGELARVVRPGGHLVVSWKHGRDERRRGGRSLDLGIGFDLYHQSGEEVEQRSTAAGFATVLTGVWRTPDQPCDQGYLLARREGGAAG